MDTPKRQASWLESFPPDIWAYLVINLTGEQIGRLMMTGATLLRRQLKSPHVVKSINIGEDLLDFPSFPTFLNEFPSLENICIDSCIELSPSYGLKLRSIPSGVRKLELFRIGKDAVSNLFGTLNLSEQLPQLETLDLRLNTVLDYSWLAHSPRSLTKLNLEDWDGTVELPSSLLHFKASSVKLSPHSFIFKLPPSLESFAALYELMGIDLVLPLLPPSTRSLFLCEQPELSNQPTSRQNLLEQLPKSLTRLILPGTDEFEIGRNLASSCLLPATLTELHIDRAFPCAAWSLLPQQITKLKFRAPGSQCTVVCKMIDPHGRHYEARSIPFHKLPRSILSLELFSDDPYFCSPLPTLSPSYFPPNLTYLDISHIQLSSETAKLLPSSLIFLEIGNLCERVCKYLPTGLKLLRAPKTLMTPNLIQYLPKSLTSLNISLPQKEDSWFDYSTGETIESVSTHPEYSIHETCISNSFDWKDSSPLPSTLTYLWINNATELADAFMRHQHLPNLLELSLVDSKHFSDLSVPLLPPHLTALNLGCSSKVSGKSFCFLPRSLTYLALNSSDSIFDSDIQHLPRTLKILYLDHAIHLTDLCISDLPPRLENLSMNYNSLITPASLQYFPYTLKSRQNPGTMGFSKWSVSHGQFCPRFYPKH